MKESVRLIMLNAIDNRYKDPEIFDPYFLKVLQMLENDSIPLKDKVLASIITNSRDEQLNNDYGNVRPGSRNRASFEAAIKAMLTPGLALGQIIEAEEDLDIIKKYMTFIAMYVNFASVNDQEKTDFLNDIFPFLFSYLEKNKFSIQAKIDFFMTALSKNDNLVHLFFNPLFSSHSISAREKILLSLVEYDKGKVLMDTIYKHSELGQKCILFITTSLSQASTPGTALGKLFVAEEDSHFRNAYLKFLSQYLRHYQISVDAKDIFVTEFLNEMQAKVEKTVDLLSIMSDKSRTLWRLIAQYAGEKVNKAVLETLKDCSDDSKVMLACLKSSYIFYFSSNIASINTYSGDVDCTVAHFIMTYQNEATNRAFVGFLKEFFAKSELDIKAILDYLSPLMVIIEVLKDSRIKQQYLELIKTYLNDKRLSADDKNNFLNEMLPEALKHVRLNARYTRDYENFSRSCDKKKDESLFLNRMNIYFNSMGYSARERLSYLNAIKIYNASIGFFISQTCDYQSIEAYCELVEGFIDSDELTFKEKIGFLKKLDNDTTVRDTLRVRGCASLHHWELILLKIEIKELAMTVNNAFDYNVNDIKSVCERLLAEKSSDINIKLAIARLFEFGKLKVSDFPNLNYALLPLDKTNHYEYAAAIYRYYQNLDTSFASTYHLAILILEQKVQPKSDDILGESGVKTTQELGLSMLSSIPESSPFYLNATAQICSWKQPASLFKLKKLVGFFPQPKPLDFSSETKTLIFYPLAKEVGDCKENVYFRPI